MMVDGQSLEEARAENDRLRARIADLERTVEALERRETIARTTLDAIQDLVYVRDLEYRFAALNKSYLELIGMTREEVVGKRDAEVFPPQIVEAFRVADQRVLGTGQPVVAHEIAPRGDELREYISTKFPILGPDGAIMAIGGISVDVTERTRAEGALRKSQSVLQAILDGSPNVIHAKDSEGRYLMVNRLATRTLGRAAEDFIGKTDYDLFTAEEADLFRARDKVVRETGEPNEREELVHLPDGPRAYLSSTFPLRNEQGVVYGTCGVSTDITERRRQEEERAHLQEEIIRTQQSALRELSTPLIPVADHVVIMPLIGNIDGARAQQALETLLHGTAQHRARVAIIDITGVSNVDTQVADALVKAAKAVQLLGATTVLTGIRPEVAQTLVTLGLDIRGIVTCGTLQVGIAYALARERAT